MKKTKIKKDLSNKLKEIGSGNKVRGITLISLVITIIVLLILAGITVAQFSGNGLFDRTRVAKEKYQNAQDDEDDKIAQYGNEIDSYISSDRTFDINNIELDYDHKIDISGYKSNSNKYSVPTAGIVAVSAHETQNQTSSININDISYTLCRRDEWRRLGLWFI